MAKYKLNKQGTKVVDCDVLCESGRGGYVVRMGNGEIRNVRKRDVRSLNEMDNAVLGKKSLNEGIGDEIVKYGQKVAKKAKDIARAVKNFFIRMFRVEGCLFFSKDDKIMPVSHPVNIMECVADKEGINYYPSDLTVEIAEAEGIEPRMIENFKFEGEYDGTSYIDPKDFGLNESVKDPGSLMDLLLETEITLSSRPAGGEGKEGDDIIQDVADWEYGEIVSNLYRRYRSRLSRKKRVQNESIMLILGAPGIGKSAILNKIRDSFESDFGRRPGLVSFNARMIGPDSFSFPAKVTESLKDLNKNKKEDEKEQRRVENTVKFANSGKAKAGSATAPGEMFTNKSKPEDFAEDDTDDVKNGKKLERTRIEDLPKTWMPVYNPEADDWYEQDCIANGGYVDEETGEAHQGPGGVLFIDEFTRMNADSWTTLMPLALERHFGNTSLTLGSRWIVVAAANRNMDMGSMKSQIRALEPDAATNARLFCVNYVPDFDMWLKWACQKLSVDAYIDKFFAKDDIFSEVTARNMREHFSEVQAVHPLVTAFLDDHRNEGYFYKMDVVNGKNGFTNAVNMASPRSWTQVSEDMYDMISLDGKLPDEKTFYRETAPTLGQPIAREFTRYVYHHFEITKEMVDEIPDYSYVNVAKGVFSNDTIGGRPGSENLKTLTVHMQQAAKNPSLWTSEMSKIITDMLPVTDRSADEDILHFVEWILMVAPYDINAKNNKNKLNRVYSDYVNEMIGLLCTQLYGENGNTENLPEAAQNVISLATASDM